MTRKIFVSVLLSVLLTFICSLSVVLAEDAPDKSSEYNNYSYVKASYKNGIVPPYSLNNSVAENINPATGELEIKQTDLQLKGRNGLDFSLTRYYNQNNAALNEPYVTSSPNYSTYNQFIGYKVTCVLIYAHYNKNGAYLSSSVNYIEVGPFTDYVEAYITYYDWSTRPDYSYIENPQEDYCVIYYDATEPYDVYTPVQYISSYTYNSSLRNTTGQEKYSDLGSGWSLDLPYIEKREDFSYLVYGSAGTWQIDFGSAGGQSHLKDYPFKDMILNNGDSSYSNGQASSNYVLTEKNGKKTYFASDGRLLGIKDRFGNEIKFQHDTARTGSPIINKIIDSIGREINISYSPEQIIITVDDPTNNDNKRTITYNKARMQGYSSEYVLDNVIDSENRQTKYAYDYKQGNISLLNKNAGSGAANVYACLTKITAPTAAETQYIYGKYTKNCGNDGVMEFYKVNERFDSKGDGIQYNYRKFSYRYNGTGEYDGYSSYYTEADIPDTYVTQTKVEDEDQNYELYTYNKKLLCTGVLSEGSDHKKEIINEYNDANKRLLTKTINRLYNKNSGLYIDSVENYQYDANNYRDLIYYWDARAGGDIANTENKTSYTYESSYHQLIGKSYKQDAGTAIEEELTASSDGKSIEWSKVKANGILKKQTRYLYDTYGNIIEERAYLDNWADYISTRYNYDDNDAARNGKFNGAYLTKKYVGGAYIDGAWKDGAEDADGVNLGISEENYKYNWFGNMVEKQDGNGNKTSYLYDKLNRTKKEMHNADGSYKEWTYRSDADENSIITKDENCNSTQYSSYGNMTKLCYDEIGNLILEQVYMKDPADNTDKYITVGEYSYDPYGRLDWEKRYSNAGCPDYTYTHYTYYSDGRLNTKEINGTSGSVNKLLNKEQYTYNDADSTGTYSVINKTIQGDEDTTSIKTNTYINKYGQVEKQGRIHNGSELVDTFAYDYSGNKIEEKSARAYSEGWTEPYTAKYSYNYEGKVVNTYNIKGDYTTAEYDSLGRAVKVYDIKGNKASVPYCTSYRYDYLGRVIEEIIPFEDDSGTRYYSVKKHYYDKNGNVILERASANKPGEAAEFNQTGYEYTNRNMLAKVITYDNAVPENYTQYDYDFAGNKRRMYTGLSAPLDIYGLDAVSPTGDTDYSATKYEYDHSGNLVKMIDPLNHEENYAYDLNGNMVRKTDRNENVITSAYDALNRVLTTSTVTPGGQGNASHAYTYTLTGAKASTDSTAYQYDDLGRIIKEAEPNGIEKTYTYDAADNRKSLVIKQNDAVKTDTSYTYDNMNRLQQVFENGQLQAAYEYDANSNRQSLAYSNGNSSEYSYNLANKLTLLTNKKDGTVLSSYAYTYYLDGNQESKTDQDNKSTEYAYDGLGRLTDEAEKVNGNVAGAIAYTYDDSNNRKTMTVTGANPSETAYSYDAGSRLITETKTVGDIDTVTSYYYDYNGNQTCKVISTIKPSAEGEAESIDAYVAEETTGSAITFNEYNGFNQLTKVSEGSSTFSYEYDGDGLRISKTVNGVVTRQIWDGDQLALELDSTGSVTNKYIRGINLIYAEDGTDRKWYLFNGHGDVVQLTGNDGNVTKDYDYDAFGNEKNPDANDNNPFRYSGEYFDKETGTIYLRARYYNPEIGRFISEDSYWGKDSDPLSLNLYTYCENNPVMYTDPSGHAVNQGVRVLKASLESKIDVLDGKIGDLYDSLVYVSGNMSIYSGVLNQIQILSKERSNLANQLKGLNKSEEIATATVFTVVGKTILGKVGSLVGKLFSKEAISTGKGFNTFNEAKKFLGSPGESNQWHHIVEQSQIQKSGFSATQIQNTNNLIAIDKTIHAKISGYYNTKSFDFTGGLSVRDWLAGQSYKAQYEFGMNVLKKFGVTK